MCLMLCSFDLLDFFFRSISAQLVVDFLKKKIGNLLIVWIKKNSFFFFFLTTSLIGWSMLRSTECDLIYWGEATELVLIGGTNYKGNSIFLSSNSYSVSSSTMIHNECHLPKHSRTNMENSLHALNVRLWESMGKYGKVWKNTTQNKYS